MSVVVRTRALTALSVVLLLAGLLAPDVRAAAPTARAARSSLSGLVTDAATGAPLAGAAVLVGGTAVAFTGADGRYQAAYTGTGPAPVVVRLPGYEPFSTGPLTLSSSTPTAADAALVRGSGAVSGRVTSASAPIPLADAWVSAAFPVTRADGTVAWVHGAAVRTDAQGRYTLPLGAGAHRIRFRKGGYGETWWGGSYGAAGGREVTLAAGQRAGGIDVALGNPLGGGRPWGVYYGPSDMVWQWWNAASDQRRAEVQPLLSVILDRPKAQWMGDWTTPAEVGRFIQATTQGDPDVLVQMAVFRMVPWEHDACRRLPSPEQQASYKQWTDQVAQVIGDTHMVLILQPDGPFATCHKRNDPLYSRLIGYATRVFSSLPNTAVYIDAGADDWNRSPQWHRGKGPLKYALRLLLPAGIEHARGFAFNSTHYDRTEPNVRYAARIVAALEKRGIKDKHAVINTSSNGRGFPGYEYQGRTFDHIKECNAKGRPHPCVTLGIPPTLDVASKRWGMSASVRRLAAEHVDAYLWFGRPWLYWQNKPFLLDRALKLAKFSPYRGVEGSYPKAPVPAAAWPRPRTP